MKNYFAFRAFVQPIIILRKIGMGELTVFLKINMGCTNALNANEFFICNRILQCTSDVIIRMKALQRGKGRSKASTKTKESHLLNSGEEFTVVPIQSTNNKDPSRDYARRKKIEVMRKQNLRSVKMIDNKTIT